MLQGVHFAIGLKGYRVKPNEKIIEHIKFLKKYNVRQLDIGDENFGSIRNNLENLLRK